MVAEELEPRVCLSVSTAFTVETGELKVEVDGADQVQFGEVDGRIRVNGEDVGVSANQVKTIVVDAVGDHRNRFDLSQVEHRSFPALSKVTLHAGDGDDEFFLFHVTTTVDGGNGYDAITIVGDGMTTKVKHTVVPSSEGQGDVTVNGATASFTSLEELNIVGAKQATLNEPTELTLVVQNGSVEINDRKEDALRITGPGSDGRDDMIPVHLRDIENVVINTGYIEDPPNGWDMRQRELVKFVSADNDHGNTNFSILHRPRELTNAEIIFEGNVEFSGELRPDTTGFILFKGEVTVGALKIDRANDIVFDERAHVVVTGAEPSMIGTTRRFLMADGSRLTAQSNIDILVNSDIRIASIATLNELVIDADLILDAGDQHIDIVAKRANLFGLFAVGVSEDDEDFTNGALETSVQSLVAGGLQDTHIVNLGDLLVERAQSTEGPIRITTLPPLDGVGVGTGSLTIAGSWSERGLFEAFATNDVVLTSGIKNTTLLTFGFIIEFGGDLIVEPGFLVDQGCIFNIRPVGPGTHTVSLEGIYNIPFMGCGSPMLVGSDDNDTIFLRRNTFGIAIDGGGGSDVFEIVHNPDDPVTTVHDSGPSSDTDKVILIVPGAELVDTGALLTADGQVVVDYANIESVVLLEVPGDFDGDRDVTDADIDALFAAVAANDTRPRFDVNRNGSTDGLDISILIQNILGTRSGDINLDLAVTFSDFLLFSTNFGRHNAGWADGDFNGDKLVNFADFLLLSMNFEREDGKGFIPAEL